MLVVQRPVLQTIALTPFRGSNSDTNVAWYEEDSRVSPEEIVIQLRTRDEKIVGSSKARKNNRVALATLNTRSSPEHFSLPSESFTPIRPATVKNFPAKIEFDRTSPVSNICGDINRLSCSPGESDNNALQLMLQSLDPEMNLQVLEDHLVRIKRNICRLMPTSRLESSRASHYFHRASPYLLSFKKCSATILKQLVQRRRWSDVVEFSLMTAAYACQLPDWENAHHNAIKSKCCQSLSAHCLSALQQLSADRVLLSSVRLRLAKLCVANQQFKSCLNAVDLMLHQLCANVAQDKD